MRVCVFTAASRRFGLPVQSVLELFAAERLTPVPTAPALVAGAVHRRGSIVPVLHLPPPLGVVEAIGDGQGLLRVSHDGVDAVTPVDAVLGVEEVRVENAVDLPDWVQGRFQSGGVPAYLLDPRRLIEAWTREVADAVGSVGAVPMERGT